MFLASHKNKEHPSVCRRISSFRIVGCLAMLIERNPTLRLAETRALKLFASVCTVRERVTERRWLNNSAVETRSREMFTSDNNYIRHYGTSVIYDAHYVLCIAGITLVCCAVHKEPRRAERMTTGFDKHITRKRSILPWPRATARSSAQIASLYRRLMPADVGVYRRNGIALQYISVYIYDTA